MGHRYYIILDWKPLSNLNPIKPLLKKNSKDIWEHAIPAKVIVDELIKMIENNCFKGIDRLLELYEIAGQRPLTKDDNKLLDTMKSSMPDGWNWRDVDVDCFARYNAVGIEIKAK